MEYQILLIEVMATPARRAGFLLRGVVPFFLLAQRMRPRVLLPHPVHMHDVPGAYQSGRQTAQKYLYKTGRIEKKPKDICWA